MKRAIFLFAILFAVLLNAQTPLTMSFQGVATDISGNNLPDGNYMMLFKIYTAPATGGSSWSETQNVNVSDGVFNVVLGSVNPLSIPFDTQYWLGVKIESDPELAPRIELTSSPYALTAATVDDYAIYTDKLDDGAVTTDKIDDGAVTQAKLAGGITATPSGSAGGDLDGSYPNPTVVGLQNRSVSSSAPSSGEVLKWDGSNWAPATDVTGGGSLWSANGSDIYYSSGNVGIGTSSPGRNLEIYDNIDDYVGIDITNPNTGNSSSEGIYFNDENGGVAGIRIYDDGHVYASQMGIFNNRPGGSIALKTFYGEMRFSNQGYLGVRTGNPLMPIHSYNENNSGVLGSELGIQIYPGDFHSTSVFAQTINSQSYRGYGLIGQINSPTSTINIGVYGESIGGTWSDIGLMGAGYGSALYSIGIYGVDNGSATIGNYAGYFEGDVEVTGTLSKSAGTFKIDHPQDPANKYLIHSFVESPDMMNVYNGNITTDNSGEAVVNLPGYFESLNIDFRYQLTVIGEFAQAIVAEKIENNQFVIKTDKPNIEVSWQVTGIRNDEYARANRIVPEVDKKGVERGRYLHPELFGKSKNEGMPVSIGTK